MSRQNEKKNSPAGTGSGELSPARIRRRAAIAAAVIFAVLAVSSYFALKQLKTAPDGARAAVYQNGVLISELSIDKEESFRIENGDGWNDIEVTKDGIRVTGASCPDGICMNAVWKGSGSLPIVCLPNRLVITAAESDDDGLDVITY